MTKYIIVTGTAREVEDKLDGKMPTEVDVFVEKEVWVATDPASKPELVTKKVPVPTPHKVVSVEEVYGLQNLSDSIFAQAVKAEVEEWKEDDGSSSGSEA